MSEFSQPVSDRPSRLAGSAVFGPPFEASLVDLQSESADLEAPGAWPADQFARMAQSGVLGWVIPQEFGGTDVSTEELTFGYQQLARACLVTTFVLTQRNGACQRIAAAQHDEVKAELLPPLCRGEVFATVGISHLTTSRQHVRKPVVVVRRSAGGYVFDGTIPWVTGAKFSDYIVTGGTCDDGRQVLAIIPTAAAGVEALEPAELLALNASQTGTVELHEVEIDEKYLIAGPVPQVMKHGQGGGTGSLATSALALGAAARSLEQLAIEAEKRPDLVEIVQSLERDRHRIAADLSAASRGAVAPDDPSLSTESIRQRSNSLVLRASQAYLAASKGAGFVAGHPAGRAVREAMFFLVWSCPQPVLTAALREFACVLAGD